jgi:hypothetical protein
MKLGTETGSMINHLMSTSKQPIPQVGMGVTMTSWTDRYAGTIIKVTPKTITVQYDRAKIVSGSTLSEDQTYEYTPDPDGSILVFRLRKNGQWRNLGGMGLLIGHRNSYRDPTF